MKRRLLALITALLLCLLSCADAASYTLPEKMKNQLAIGSGLKGTISVYAEGDISRFPFIHAISNAVYNIRGITADHDLHYSIFQSDNADNQTARTEIYRKDGVYYFRSDMVQGKILQIPAMSQFMDRLYPAKGENPTVSSIILNYLTMPTEERKEKWTPVLTRYQNELEMWLADFTVQADVIKQDNGNSALDFTYIIPAEAMKSKILDLFRDFASDPEILALLDNIMTPEEKRLFVNSDLSYYYEEALSTMDINRDIVLKKRVSAMGDVLLSELDLPLDARTTGYHTLSIKSGEELTVYDLRNDDTVLILAIPSFPENKQEDYQKSIWFSRLTISTVRADAPESLSFRADIQKKTETHEDSEGKSHQTDQYTITIQPDETYIPDGIEFKPATIFKDIQIDVSLHYSSKYSQNSATALEIEASYKQGDSSLTLSGKLKTAAPWMFMPFEIIDPIKVGADNWNILQSYITDWISNAPSIIHYSEAEEEKEETNEAEVPGDTDASAETQPLEDQPEETGSDE